MSKNEDYFVKSEERLDLDGGGNSAADHDIDHTKRGSFFEETEKDEENKVSDDDENDGSDDSGDEETKAGEKKAFKKNVQHVQRLLSNQGLGRSVQATLEKHVQDKNEGRKLENMISNLDSFSGIDIQHWYLKKRQINKDGDAFVGLQEDAYDLSQLNMIRFQTNNFVVMVDLGGNCAPVKTIVVDIITDRLIEYENDYLVSVQSKAYGNTLDGLTKEIGRVEELEELIVFEPFEPYVGDDFSSGPPTNRVESFAHSGKLLDQSDCQLATIIVPSTDGKQNFLPLRRLVINSLPNLVDSSKPIQLELTTKHLNLAEDSSKAKKELKVLSGFGSVGAKIIGNLLLSPCSCQFLTSLDVSNNRISSLGIKSLIDSLKSLKRYNCVLLNINVSHNVVGGDGAAKFAELIIQNCFIRTLNLASNNIDAIGCHKLAKALESNKTLESIDLSENEGMSRSIGVGASENEIDGVGTGVNVLFQALRKNTSLKTLRLSKGSCYNMKETEAEVS